VRLSVGALRGVGTGGEFVVVLNRFDPSDELHRRNRAWLRERDGLVVMAVPEEEADLVSRIRGM
jgi:dethiobiotin synthetase